MQFETSLFETGTSGDTGSAAITAVQGLKWVDIVVLLPKGRCTEIQVKILIIVGKYQKLRFYTLSLRAGCHTGNGGKLSNS